MGKVAHSHVGAERKIDQPPKSSVSVCAMARAGPHLVAEACCPKPPEEEDS